MDSTDPSPNFFAAELFQSHNNATLGQDTDIVMEEEARHSQDGETTQGINDDFVKQEAVENTYPPLDDDAEPAQDSSIIDMVAEVLFEENKSPQSSPERVTKPRPKHSSKSRQNDPSKSSIHSSKNEGQHTDRRYLCYLCDKLFTRRRSVRDHISKIHNTKTWEPVRSLEVIVDPISGEPLEPVEVTIARGPPPPPPKVPKSKASRAAKREEEDEDDEESAEESTEEDDHTANPGIARLHGRLPSEISTPPPSSAVASLKREPSLAGSRASSTEPFATPAPVAGKKRLAQDDLTKSSAASKKKGTAKVKSSTAPNKRFKLSESEQTSPIARSAYRSPSATPASMQLLKPVPSRLKKQTSAASVRSSPTPISSRAESLDADSASSSVADTPTSSNDDGEVFCICRKGDNHTWMIACDGGCDEWFHGNCVNIRERDGELIDKYICPTCKRPGLQTTWKRMCRRKDCRKPARVMQDPPSKYCSDACGRMFFVELVERGDPRAQHSKDGQYIVQGDPSKKRRKKQKKSDARSKATKPAVTLVNGDIANLVNSDSRLATPAHSEDEKSEYETDSSLDDDMLPNRGAALRAGEIKALLEKCKTIDEWRALGRKPDTPPGELDMSDPQPVQLDFDDLETVKMASIDEEKQRLNELDAMLTAREAFLGVVKTRSGTITEEVRKTHPKMKDLCGFDPRMAWSGKEFETWYKLQGGKEILNAGANAKIGPPDDKDDGDRKPNGVNGVNNTPDGLAGEDEEEAGKMPRKGGVCIKNRCPRHKSWAKGQLAELRFEQDLVRRSLARCEAQQNQIKERAVVRAWENRA